MPMFDDPNKELQWLQDELLAAEDDDLFDDLDDLLRDYEAEPEAEEDLDDLLLDYEETSLPRKHKEAPKKEPKPKKEIRFGKKAAVQDEPEAPMDDDSVFYKEDYRKAKKKEKSGNRVLLLIIAAELIAIVAILGRWLTWLI